MSKAKVTFHKLIQDTQDLAAGDPNQNHMISRAFFTLGVDGKEYSDMSVTLRQPFGTDYVTEPIEVEKAQAPMPETGTTTISETPSKNTIAALSAAEAWAFELARAARTFVCETTRSASRRPMGSIFQIEAPGCLSARKVERKTRT